MIQALIHADGLSPLSRRDIRSRRGCAGVMSEVLEGAGFTVSRSTGAGEVKKVPIASWFNAGELQAAMCWIDLIVTQR